MDARRVEIINVEVELTKKKKTYTSVNLAKLPDKGARLKQQIEELESTLKLLSLESTVAKDIKKEQSCSDPQVNDHEKLNNIVEVKNSKAKNVSEDLKSINKLERHTKDDTFLKIDENAMFGSSFNISDTSKMLSFGELAKHAPKDADKNYGASPSFSKRRDVDNIHKIQLTEAKSLIEAHNPGKTYNRNLNALLLPETSEECVKKLHHALVTYPEDSKEESDPEGLKSQLMIHQKKGLAWLVWREEQDPSGGILADDMGLGKTITIISLILKQKEKVNYFAFKKESSECKGTLIICIASIIHQWNEEILRHCENNSLKVLVYHGPKREKNIKTVMKHDVVITTYNILMCEWKTHDSSESPLFKLKWERVVLDEAHIIKNHRSLTAQAIFNLRAFRKWAVTGTPIHNDFKDMYSLLKFLEFSPFDDYKKFKKLIDDSSESSEKRRSLLVKSILLRRTKEQIDNEGNRLIELKNKTISLCYIELSDEEKKVYDKYNEKITKKIDQYLMKSSKINSGSSLLVLLLRLQQCCNHVSLLKDEVEECEDDISSDITKNMLSLTIDSDSITNSSTCSLNLTLDEIEINSNLENKSSKINKLFEKLKEVAANSQNKDKSVIVSQWVSMLKVIAFHLEQEDIPYHKIVGTTKAEDRQKAAEDFNKNKDGAKIMLLSLKAGGVGLNLIGANHLFLLDLHWNPALEMQACDRIHRVGQEKDVTIHKFVCKNTIEEKILLLQDHKRAIASNVLHAKKPNTKGLTMEDFKTLFGIK